MTTSITIEVPDAWITEDNVLFLVHRTYVGLPVLAERANRELEEWDYPHRFNCSTLLAARERLWVDPAFIMSEVWPKSAVSREQREGWVRVLRIDLDAVDPGSTVPCSHCGGDTFEHCLATPSCTGPRPSVPSSGGAS